MIELLAGRLPRTVAVYGYNLEDGQEETLRRHAVAVYRRLQARVFRFLRRAVRTVPAATAPGPTSDRPSGRRVLSRPETVGPRAFFVLTRSGRPSRGGCRATDVHEIGTGRIPGQMGGNKISRIAPVVFRDGSRSSV